MITDLLGGLVQFSFATLSAVLPHIKAGSLNSPLTNSRFSRSGPARC